MAANVEMGMAEATSPATLKAAFAELLATALFIFAGVGTVASMFTASGAPEKFIGASPALVVGIAIAFGLMIAVLAAGIGGISGGHINPAVTFAMIITGNISVAKGLIYIVAQLIGATIGMLLLKAFLAGAIIDAIPGAGGNAINTDLVPSKLAAVGLEAIGTFILVWTVFATAVTRKNNSGIAAPLYIGLSVLLAHIILIPFTGTGINPARTFGPALVMGAWDDHWVYWAGPLIGAAIAALSYTFIYLADEEVDVEVVVVTTT
jgi:MIP family channel proteins